MIFNRLLVRYSGSFICGKTAKFSTNSTLYQNRHNSSVLRWGIAGGGKISTDFVSAVTADSADKHQFVAVASRTLNEAEQFAITRSIPKVYSSYNELAKDSDVQIVHVGVLNPDHYDTAKLFLENGKHVLLEKPFAMNAKQAASLVKLAREKKLFLMEGLWSRFLPSNRFTMDQIHRGAIGQPYSVDVSFGVGTHSKLDRLIYKKLGGGAILDIGCYAINIIQQVFNNEPPIKIKAVGYLNEDGVDQVVAAALSYSGGRTATLRLNFLIDLPCEAAISGTKGFIKMFDKFHCAQKVQVNGADHDLSYPANRPEMNYPNSRGLRFEADEVYRLLMAGKLESDLMPHEHSIQIARIQDEIRRQVGVRFEADNFPESTETSLNEGREKSIFSSQI